VTAAVDFLPASYRVRVAASRTRRERLLLALPVLAALLATDAVLRSRVRIAGEMAAAADAHATRGEQRAEQTAQLAQRVAAARETLEQWIEPMAAPRLSAVVDDVLADRPAGMRLQSLWCRHEPWSRDPTPAIRIEATCPSADAFTAYLAMLRDRAALPSMQCLRTYAGPDSGIGFQLQSATAAEAPR
jgi:hypothetical protein